VTLVLYLTDAAAPSGQTYFPAAGVTVAPRRGTVLSFANVDATGAPDAKAKHGVSRVAADAPSDRFVVQIPIVHAAPGERAVAYAEHVSGTKHKAHMGVMVLILLGLGAYALWQRINKDPDAPALLFADPDGRI